jgi:hypothetical protein
MVVKYALLFRYLAKQFCLQPSRQATPVLFGVAMICMMDLAMSEAPHFGLARCRTGLSSTSTTKITRQSAYTGKVYIYYMASEHSSHVSHSSEARVYDVVTYIA